MWYSARMIKVLEDAIEKVKTLPENRQLLAAEVLEDIISGSQEAFQIPAEDLPAVFEGAEQAKRGEFASDAEVDELLNKPWR